MKTKNLIITIGFLFLLSFTTDLLRVYSKLKYKVNLNLSRLDEHVNIQGYDNSYTDLRTLWLVLHIISLVLLIGSVVLLIFRVIKFKMK